MILELVGVQGRFLHIRSNRTDVKAGMLASVWLRGQRVQVLIASLRPRLDNQANWSLYNLKEPSHITEHKYGEILRYDGLRYLVAIRAKGNDDCELATLQDAESRLRELYNLKFFERAEQL